MRNEQPIGATKRRHKRVRLIEVDRGDGDTAGQLGRIGPPGQRDEFDCIRAKKTGQRRADATGRPGDGDPRLARGGLNFFGTYRYILILEQSVQHIWNDRSKMSSEELMSGKPQFDETAVIAAATEVFRRHGYAAAAVSDLTEATGLSRSSLYQRFHDKDG